MNVTNIFYTIYAQIMFWFMEAVIIQVGDVFLKGILFAGTPFLRVARLFAGLIGTEPADGFFGITGVQQTVVISLKTGNVYKKTQRRTQNTCKSTRTVKASSFTKKPVKPLQRHWVCHTVRQTTQRLHRGAMSMPPRPQKPLSLTATPTLYHAALRTGA